MGLDAKFRWCLTGTPITNGLNDLFPIMRFVRVRPWFDWSEWRDSVARYEKRNPNLAAQRAQAALLPIILRRMKDTLLDGKPLINLPPKTIIMEELELSSEELAIYKAVESRAQIQFNKFLKQNSVLKNYAHSKCVLFMGRRALLIDAPVLVMALRLR